MVTPRRGLGVASPAASLTENPSPSQVWRGFPKKPKAEEGEKGRGMRNARRRRPAAPRPHRCRPRSPHPPALGRPAPTAPRAGPPPSGRRSPGPRMGSGEEGKRRSETTLAGGGGGACKSGAAARRRAPALGCFWEEGRTLKGRPSRTGPPEEGDRPTTHGTVVGPSTEHHRRWTVGPDHTLNSGGLTALATLLPLESTSPSCCF